MVVWRSFQAARPSSALTVSLPILEDMTAPLSSDESIGCPGGEGFEEADDEDLMEEDEDWWNRREKKNRKAAAEETRRNKRRLAMMARNGMVYVAAARNVHVGLYVCEA